MYHTFNKPKKIIAASCLLLVSVYPEVQILVQSCPAPVAQSVAFALPKTDCWEDLDRIPPGGGKRDRDEGSLGHSLAVGR